MWCLYKHISPSGKVYIGITNNIKRRWLGKGYYYRLSKTKFANALQKYGWDNFQHIVIEEGLTKEEACNKEKELIAYYKGRNLSYNITDGGEGYAGKHSTEHVKHRVESRLQNKTIDYIIIDKEFNYIICDTEKEAATFLDGTQRNIAHLLTQPIGYTFRGHYVWKHQKGTPVDIDNIRNKIEMALYLRRQKMSQHAKELLPILIENSKKARKIKK